MAIWYTDSARSAIRLALQMEGLGDGEALLPAYLCDTLLAPFRERGLTVRFYDVNPDLSINLGDLSRRLSPRSRVLLFIHYFGFPQPEPVRRYLAELARAPLAEGGQTDGGPVIIEDLTHAVWTEGPSGRAGRVARDRAELDRTGFGRIGHYTVASYRKFGQPFDGGFLRRNHPGADAGGQAALSAGGHLAPAALPLLQPWPSPAHCLSALAWSLDRVGAEDGAAVDDARGMHRARGDVAQDLWEQVEVEYGREHLPRTMAPGTRELLAQVDKVALAQRRRAAYQEALKVATESPFGRPLWPELPEGVCPLVLPVQSHSAAERGPMRAWLARQGLQTVLLWPLAPGVTPQELPGVAEAAVRTASVLLPLSTAENRAL